MIALDLSTSLSKLVNNLSEIYSKKCRHKNCKSECDFKGHKSNKLSYRCKKKQLKPINGLIKKFSNTYKFCNEDFNKFIFLLRKVFIDMNTWIVETDLMKSHFEIKKLFTVNYI